MTTVTPNPVTSTRVVTVSGGVVTQTVTTTPTPYVSPDALTREQAQRKSLSGGAIAGAVVGSVLGLALLLLGALLLWRRRRPADDPEKRNGMKRNASVLSKVGLLSSARAVEREKSFDDTPYAGGGLGSQRQSMLYGAGAIPTVDIDPPASASGGVYESGTFDSRRNSRPLVYDQRLNPAALMNNWDNGSRTSVNTMQDQRDYSRPLNIANPDLYD